MRRFIDMAGKKYGRIVVLDRAPNKSTGHAVWYCRCACKTIFVARGTHLRKNRVFSCGHTGCRRQLHGMSQSVEHAIWRGMISRCENANLRCYKHYGGRGIGVAMCWRDSFKKFYSDMGARPSSRHSLDRLDNDRGYEPGNVVWALPHRQANNKRRTRYVTYRGRRMPLCDAVRLAGSFVHHETAWVRIDRSGWSVEKAVETPRLHESPNSKSRIKTQSQEAA